MKQDLNGVRTPEDVMRRLADNVKITSDEVNGLTVEVSKKVNGNEVISAINLSPERAAIKANKIKLEGYTTINEGFSIDEQGNMSCNNAVINGTITSDNGNIGGWNIYNEGLTNGDVKIMNNGGTSVYTMADYVIVQMHIMGTVTLSGKVLEHYDLNGDGVVDMRDWVLLQNILKLDD